MLKEAVNYYNELLEDSDLSSTSFDMLQSGLERNRLIFGGRPLSPYLRPHFVTSEDWSRVVRICETIWGTLQKVKNAAIENESLLATLGVNGIEKELIEIDPGYRHVSPTSRLDSFLTEDSYSFVELNGESPAGIAYADSAAEIYRELPIMRAFAERYELSSFAGRQKMLDVLLDCWNEFSGGQADKNPVIAIVDLEGLPTQKEFELFADYFAGNGYNALICSPQELEFDQGKLYYAGVAIDIVYKRLLVNEYLPIVDEYPALRDAYRSHAVCMVNSFRAKLVHKKAIFAILTDERYSYLFEKVELDAIKAHIPWTRTFHDGTTTYSAGTIDLVEWTRTNADKLVLKPNDDYGGHGIYIGWNSTHTEWDDAISLALENGDYLVQERVRTAKEMFPMMFDSLGKWGMVEQLVDLDPLLFNGKVGSAFTRLSSTELANVSSGGGMVPTFVIDYKQ